ncbi:MAG: hypothetical protein KF888_01455 [Nitrosomonas sp.]|nr:hypothetical protein [Nitrosomonas sp.]
MQHIKRFRHMFYVGFLIFADIKICYFVDAINLCQVCVEYEVYVVTVYILHQWWHKSGHTEQYGSRNVEFDFNSIQVSIAQPMVTGQVHRFLWRSGAFDRHGRLGKKRFAAPEILDQ